MSAEERRNGQNNACGGVFVNLSNHPSERSTKACEGIR